MNYIHVCFALHDAQGRYSKYLGIAIMSLFEHTTSTVCVHILCDDTVNSVHKKRFQALARQYGQEIRFYQINTSNLISFKTRVATLSIGTLFRLQMGEVLPDNLQRIIYLDDDLLVNMDISELWDVDLTGYVLAACHDPGIPFRPKAPHPCVAGWVSADDYFNAGVMVINLTELRRRECFFKECIKFLADNPECSLADQDVFNVYFNGQVFYLPQYCNLFSRLLRREIDMPRKGICHISGDYVDSEKPFWFDKMFFEYWERSPWSIGSEIFPYFLIREQRHARQIILWQRIASVLLGSHRPFVIWGASSILQERIQALCPALAMPDWYVDSNWQRKSRDGKDIRAPETLALCADSEKPFVLVMSKKYYCDISLKLEEYGYHENDDYGDAALLLLQSQGGVFAGY